MNWGGIAFVLLCMCAPFAAHLHEKKTLNENPENTNRIPAATPEEGTQ